MLDDKRDLLDKRDDVLDKKISTDLEKSRWEDNTDEMLSNIEQCINNSRLNFTNSSGKNLDYK